MVVSRERRRAPDRSRQLRSLVSVAVAALGAAFLATSDSAAGVSHFFYDTSGRLIGVTSSTSHVKAYTYDPADNRTNFKLVPGAWSPTGQTLSNGQAMLQDQLLTSASGAYVLRLQSDGNVIFATTSPDSLVWASDTFAKMGAYLVMQTDGNLVLLNAQLNPIWASDTFGNPGATFVVQDDGKIAIYAQNGSKIWQRPQ